MAIADACAGMKAITQSYETVEGVLITKALFSYAAPPTNETRGEGTDFGCADYPQTESKELPGIESLVLKVYSF